MWVIIHVYVSFCICSASDNYSLTMACNESILQIQHFVLTESQIRPERKRFRLRRASEQTCYGSPGKMKDNRDTRSVTCSLETGQLSISLYISILINLIVGLSGKTVS